MGGCAGKPAVAEPPPQPKPKSGPQEPAKVRPAVQVPGPSPATLEPRKRTDAAPLAPAAPGKEANGSGPLADEFPEQELNKTTEEVIAEFDHDPPVEFEYAVLAEATGGFGNDRVLGEGGFGKVYEGWVEVPRERGETEQKQVAVKLLNQEGLQGFNEWLTEVIFLRRLHHPHLVNLVGYCRESAVGALVYEYMPNGSLDYHLFAEVGPALTWAQRVKIALGAAKGLAYLHHGTQRQVIFRDLKAANILLSADFTAKLSDFGLAKDGPAGDKTHVSTKVVGTYGYTAPEYMQTGHLTVKSDVYAFGVVLLELLSGRRAVDMERPWEERSLVFWAKPFLADRRKLHNLVDPRMGEYPLKGAQKLAVSAHCCLLDAKSRPSMRDMVQTLRALQDLTEGCDVGGGTYTKNSSVES